MGAAVEWRLIPEPALRGRFEVSNSGLMRRAIRTGPTGKPAGTLVKTHVDKRYGYVRFTAHIAPRSFTYGVHCLVALAFIGPKPVGFEVAHLNGCAGDNRVENLAYVTPQENTNQKYEHGTVAFGDDVPSAKLTTPQVLRIRASRAGSLSLAAEYGVAYQQIWRIRKGLSWSHLGPVSAASPTLLAMHELDLAREPSPSVGATGHLATPSVASPCPLGGE